MRSLLSVVVVAAVAAVGGWLIWPPDEPPETRVQSVWLFEAVPRGAIVSSPLVTTQHVYVGAVEDDSPPRGAVYCLNSATGRPVWKFDDGGQMQHMYSSPCLAGGRLYIGEGMHANPRSKLYCLDALHGTKQWQFVAGGHIESTPSVAEGRVYFGAGDDGAYCLDAHNGQQQWHWENGLHVDATLSLVQGRVYGSSGISRRLDQCAAFCLDANKGELVWQTTMDLPAWGSPRVDGGQVFVGLGNGRLVGSVEQEKRAGALVCLDGASGKQLWRYDVPDGVLVRCEVDAEHVYFGARDAHLYCLHRRAGDLAWKQDLGSPIVTTPVLDSGSLYIAAIDGDIYKLHARRGTIDWSFDVASASRTQPRILSSPALLKRPDGERRVVFGAELRGWSNSAAAVYCLSEVSRP